MFGVFMYTLFFKIHYFSVAEIFVFGSTESYVNFKVKYNDSK